MFGLAWFAMLCVGAIGLLTSVLLRSTAAAMGTMLAALIAGTILPRLASQWEAQKFLFVTCLPLPDYYSGSPPPIPGLTDRVRRRGAGRLGGGGAGGRLHRLRPPRRPRLTRPRRERKWPAGSAR